MVPYNLKEILSIVMNVGTLDIMLWKLTFEGVEKLFMNKTGILKN